MEGVKATGAPPPRKVIAQQCLLDKVVLEVLCNYVSIFLFYFCCLICHVDDSFLPQASWSKKFKPSRQVVGFCTAVVVEALGSATPLDDDVVKKIIPFVSSGLHAGAKAGSDHRVWLKTLFPSNISIPLASCLQMLLFYLHL